MASTYTMVGYGSQGESVRRLQSELNKQGYQLDEDGVFGEKTRAAVRDYQKKNSLKRDGIAGDETWGSLMSASASAAEEPQASVPKAGAYGQNGQGAGRAGGRLQAVGKRKGGAGPSRQRGIPAARGL